MAVAAVAHYTLSDTPYALWVRGELADELHLPDDGTRVEVIGGEIVVSPSPTLDHNYILDDIHDALHDARTTDPSFRWTAARTSDLNLIPAEQGCVPDLNILDRETRLDTRRRKAKRLLPDEVEAVIEVTSPSNAKDDRPPKLLHDATTKWSGYARSGIPFYLLVDRDPRMPGVTLYGEPDVRAGTYEVLQTWKFGDVVRLPEPLGFEITTELWEPWDE
ncbi:Uma2 family endonuclease [Actinomadura bangladeshensis]|nr:Uma2 family endonuclease [Actinomadura bangladeshensis]